MQQSTDRDLVTFRWGQFPPIEEQLENRPDVNRKRFWRLLSDACDQPVTPDNGRNITVAHALVETLVNDALRGDHKAMAMVLERVDGKAVMGVDFSTPSGDPSAGATAVGAFFAGLSGIGGDVVDAEVIEEQPAIEHMSDLEKMQQGVWEP